MKKTMEKATLYLLMDSKQTANGAMKPSFFHIHHFMQCLMMSGMNALLPNYELKSAYKHHIVLYNHFDLN